MSIYYEAIHRANPYESSFTIDQLSGLGDWMSDLFGKPNSWYERVGQDQVDLVALSSQVASVGQTLWNIVREKLVQSNGEDLGFVPFSEANDLVQSSVKRILITNSKTPSDQDVTLAEQAIGLLRQWVAFVLGVAPEMSAEVEAEGRRAREIVGANTLRSPAEVGTEAFKEEVARRAGALVSDGKTWIIIGLSAATLALWFFGRGR